MLCKTNPTLPVPIVLRDKVDYENKICQEVLPLLNGLLRHTSSPKEEQSCEIGALQPKALALLFPSHDPVLHVKSEPTAFRDAIHYGTRTGLQPKTRFSTMSQDFRCPQNAYRQGLANQVSF